MVKKSTQPIPTNPPPPPETLTDGLPLPSVLIFDLDYTLWPFWIDTHVNPPLKAKDGGAQSTDRFGEAFSFYPSVPPLLSALKSHPSAPHLALASRTHTPDLALTLLKQLAIPLITSTTTTNGSSSSSSSSPTKRALDFFDSVQIYPGEKTAHMAKIRKALGVGYEEMLFFDDESRNRNVEELGVRFWLVGGGVGRGEFDRGVRDWRRRAGVGEDE